MKVEIFHNTDSLAAFGLNAGLKPYDNPESPGFEIYELTGDERHGLVKVFECEYADPSDLLDRVFADLNVGTSPTAKAYRARRLRSLSVGDVVRLAGRVPYSVQPSVGWEVRADSEIRVIDPTDPSLRIDTYWREVAWPSTMVGFSEDYDTPNA